MTTRRVFDLDGTLCTETQGDYRSARPIPARIAKVRALHASGETVVIDTGRHGRWRRLTVRQLAAWNCPYTELRVGRKVHGHCYVDQTAIPADDFFADDGGHAERWPDEYFAQRVGNDPRRRKAFEQEALFLINNGVSDRWEPRFRSAVCDVGCSTGEFLDYVGWSGPRYGMEISEHAKAIAETRGIDFSRNILTESAFFDVVVFRGTLQHLPRPFTYLGRAFSALKPGGYLAILATPNTDSLYYRVFGEFPPPLHDPGRNFWMPSVRTLSNALKNFGFEIVAVETTYWGGPYARPLHDVASFARRLLFGHRAQSSWPGNLMNIIARKI